MTTLIVHTKSESYCGQCEMTLKVAKAKGVAREERPGIDTEERAGELLVFKSRFNLSSAPIVEAVAADGSVVERWAGFRPDLIAKYAA